MATNPSMSGATAGATGPLTGFILLDYMTAVMKEGAKDALSEYRATTVVPGPTGPRSLAALADRYPASSQAPTGVSRVAQIARANQQLPLAAGATLTFSGVSYVPAPSSTLDAIAQQFGVAATALASVGINPQLSFMPIPQGVTSVQLVGATGATAVSVTHQASFQNLAQRLGITGAAIDPAFLWPNLEVVSQLIAAGQPLTIPTFARGLTGPTSLLSLASYYNLSVDALAALNATGPIFGPTAAVLIPNASRLTVGHLLDRLAARGFGQKTAGLAGRALLHGLRIPPPAAPTGSRQGLYQITGQQVGLGGVTAGSTFDLTYSGATAPGWLNFGGTAGPTGPTKPTIRYRIGPTGLGQVRGLAGETAYTPPGSFVRMDPFHIREKSFTLAHCIAWNVPKNPPDGTGIVPAGPTGSYGPTAAPSGAAAPLGSFFIRAFPERLQSLLLAGSTGPHAAAFTLSRQGVQPGQRAVSIPVTPYAWTTMLKLKVAQVPKKGGGSEEFVYALEGTSETETSLLGRLLTESATPQSIFLLYPATTAQAGQKTSNVALVSDPEPAVAIFQTNPSAAGGGGVALGATDLLQQIWAGDQLEDAGTYLYYRAPTSGGNGRGLPPYLFSQQPTTTVTLLISYAIGPEAPSEIPRYRLPSYVNSVVLDTAIQTASEGIFIRPVGPATGFDPNLQTKTPTIHPGHVAFRISRPNPNFPQPPSGPATPTYLLNELYSIVEARVPGQTGWHASRPGLPIGPSNPAQGPTAGVPETFAYDVTFPISRLAKVPAPTGPTGPSATNNPYAGVGATLTVDFNLLDLFGNAFAPQAGRSWMSDTIQPGYTDALLGPDSWPHLAKTYAVRGSGRLVIELAFNVNHYYERYIANEALAGVLASAQATQKSYEKIYYQLNQPDVVAAVATSFDPALRHDATLALRQFVTGCWAAISGVVNALLKGAPLTKMSPITGTLEVELSDGTGLDILPMTVTLEIVRTGTIDPNFADMPTVRRVSSSVAPMTSHGVTGTNRLSGFAAAFETAFPTFKVATGQSSETSAASRGDSKGLWLVRLAQNAGATGIYLSLQGEPTYYAPRPVATSLVNRSQVPIYDIEKGSTFNQTVQAGANRKLKSYTGLDLNTLAQQFLAAVDLALSPEMAAAAAIAAPADLQRLMQSKATLADLLSIARQDGPDPVPVVYEDSTPPPGGTAAAGQALKGELQAELGRLSKLETIVQCGAVSHWSNPAQPDKTVEFFGKFVPRVKQPHPAFAFSSSTISVSRGSTATHATALFSVNQSRSNATGATAAAETSFSDDVTFHVSGLAHDIGPSIVPGYKRSDWLSFVRPFELGDRAPAGVTATPRPLRFDIPLPLRVYPTAPALKSQIDVPRLPQFSQGQGGTASFRTATEWAYQYNYQYVGAAQDTISTKLDFNTKGSTGVGRVLLPGIDFVNDLLQFRASYPGLAKALADLPIFLADNAAATKEAVAAKLALRSLAEIVGYVAQSWATWQEYQKTYTYQYEIEQSPRPAGPTGAPILSVQVRKVRGPSGTYPHPNIPLPGIGITGFITRPTPPLSPTAVGPGATSIDYTFEAIGSTAHSPLRWEDAAQYPTRTVSFTGLDVLQQENAWAGLGVLRNQDLGKNPVTGRYRPVNPAFVFETPLVRFVNVLNPFLDPAGEILLPDEVQPASSTLEGYLAAMFAKLLGHLPQATSVLVKLGVSYGYSLGKQLPVELPMFLTTPYEYNVGGDSSFVNSVARRIKAWFAERGMSAPNPSMNGSLVFDLTIFSTLSRSQLPLLRLRYIELPCSSVSQD